MICSITLHEYGSPEEYNTENDYYSAYPTWDDSGSRVKTFRPTNAGCLMRNMSHPEFCSVCKESMWIQFLNRVSLIDSLNVTETPNPDGTRNVTLSTLQLGQLRQPGNEVVGERLEVRWMQEGVEEVVLRDRFQVQAMAGSWVVHVELLSPEVHSDPQGLLKESFEFQV